MKTDTTQAIDSEFQQDIQRLGLLSGDADKLEAFNAEYQRILEDNYTAMMQCRNVDKLLACVFRSRAEMLKALLERQLENFGLKWPDDTRLSANKRG
jgi:hypothetical protein